MTTSFRTTVLIFSLAALGLCGCSKEARKARILERANKDFAAEQFDNAEIGYLNLLRLAPGDATSIRQLGIIYFNEGRFIEAYRFLQKAAETEPENIDVQLKFGMTCLAFRKGKEARQQAEKVLVKRPGDEEALLLLAETSIVEKDVAEIQKQLEQLRQSDKDRAGYHLAFGALRMREQDYAKAEKEFKSALALEPDSGTAQLALANLYSTRNELAAAEKAFQLSMQSAPLRSSRRIKFAEFQFRNGKSDAAKTILEEITAKAPDFFPAWSLLIQIAFAERKFDECSALVTKVLAKDPGNYDALLHSGKLKLVNGNSAEAIADLDKMLKFYGPVPEIQLQLGRAYFSNGDVPKAIRNLNAALATEPNFPQAILLLAEIQVRQNDTASAVPRLLKLVKTLPQITQAHLLLASAYLLQGKTEDALAIYRRMTALFPKDPQPHYFLGITLAAIERTGEARKALQKALDIAPEYLPAFEQLVDLDIAEKAYPAALDRVSKEIQKKPSAELWLFMAKVQLAQKNNSQAEASLQKAVALNPELQIAYTLLAQLYADSNRQPEALKKLTEVSAKTNDVSVLMQMGMIYDQLKNFSAARDTYEKILVTKPKFSPALNNLAYLYSEHLGQLDKAYDMAEKARQLLPYDPSTADTLGWILFKRGNYSRALGLVQECAAKFPHNEEVQYHLGMIYYMRGEEESAKASLAKAAQSKNEFPGKAEISLPLAILQIDEKSASEADIDTLEKRIKEEPRDSVAALRLGSIYERQGATDKAAKVYETWLEKNPANARIMIRLSDIYARDLKDSKKALELAKEAHNQAPEDARISQTLGRLAYESGDYKWALSLAQEAALKLPNQPDVNFDLARSYFGVGQVAAAEAAMRKAAQSEIPFAGLEEAKRFLAMVDLYNHREKIRSATANLNSILKAEPNYIPALMVSAIFFEQNGNHQEARKHYEKVLSLNPFFAPAYRDLAILNAKFSPGDPKNYDLAVKARAAFPESAEIAKVLGILVYQRKDYTRAAQLLEESSRKNSQDSEIFYYLGLAKYNLKKMAECREALKRAMSLELSANLAEEAARILAEIK